MLLGAMPEDLVVATAKSQRATDFSIAAIMAKNASPSGRDSVEPKDNQNEGGLPHFGLPEDEDVLEDDEIEVDVEECSDTESTRPPKAKISRNSPSVSDCGSESADLDRESPDIAPEKTSTPKKPKILCNCDELLTVECHLETKDLWDKFHDLGTEMIITKTGRTFPGRKNRPKFGGQALGQSPNRRQLAARYEGKKHTCNGFQGFSGGRF
ncbi:hypothetical protein GWI33_008551 [Rhynchophorus ferrugineus]|uniref:T-box domain-containing protein n=1 Tax=Rhynchophorus ferrugineus TaxID=354439 RepID=A0A834MB04_RHYFE|nr:hypothetical protein GWI33_008551 [Rhynchophorus ferrugineus]